MSRCSQRSRVVSSLDLLCLLGCCLDVVGLGLVDGGLDDGFGPLERLPNPHSTGVGDQRDERRVPGWNGVVELLLELVVAVALPPPAGEGACGGGGSGAGQGRGGGEHAAGGAGGGAPPEAGPRAVVRCLLGL